MIKLAERNLRRAHVPLHRMTDLRGRRTVALGALTSTVPLNQTPKFYYTRPQSLQAFMNSRRVSISSRAPIISTISFLWFSSRRS